ncbi:MAG: hypothetical protein KJ676_11220 [Alphaproteobacteria bacterium]|nr:hypothetical protein [Alphaproteobacteria bacterium]MBU1525546.1 hypothetical protein [Alphaproteobacteria bacterium]MBU2117781.1 hypothetical protein [Alphaproteobacteria bacterium]MBU2350481.1 hypothetical protein [Alphaproteobacteria bacterium]MBU2381526.1 hypothetical protein [Alphaproteobacteria bacterium]
MAARFWLEDHQGLVGMALALILIGGLWLWVAPHIPARPVTGRVLGPSVIARSKSAVNGVEVQVDGRVIKVPAPLHYGCDPGDRIMLSKRRVRGKDRYGLANVGRICTPFP